MFFRNAIALTMPLINHCLLALFLGLSSVCFAESYVTAKLVGQLGNQLFQIAAATSLALEHDATPAFPDLIHNQDFNIPLNYSKVLSHLNTSMNQPVQFHYHEPHFPYSPIPYRPNMCIQGWFQSEKYFAKHKNQILELFAPSLEIEKYLKTQYREILKHPCTVSIHFRSYLMEGPNQRAAHPTQTKSYFEKAIAHYPEEALFVVCSNDIEWCKSTFSTISRNFVFIEGEPHYHDFYLMSLCKHNIICNSSFSWWSAYLNRNTAKIITAPRKWFADGYGSDCRDLIPDGWIKID